MKQCIVFSVALLFVVPSVQGGEWHYSLEYEPSYSTNIARTAKNEQEEVTHALRVGLRYNERSALMDGSVSLDVEHRSYVNGVFADQNWSYLNADVTWSLVRDRLFWVVEDRLSNEPVMNRQVWVPGNIQQTNLFSTGPRLSYRFDNGIGVLADLRYMNSYAEITDEFDSDRWYLAGSLFQDLSVQTEVSSNLTMTKVDFRSRDADDYRRLDLFAAWDWQQGRSGLRFELGGSRIDFDYADSASGPHIKIVGNRRISSVSQLKVVLHRGYSDAAQQLRRDSRAVQVGSNVISSQVYTVSEGEVSYRTEWLYSTLEAILNYQKQAYLDSTTLDQDLFNGSLVMSRGFGVTLSTELGVSYSRSFYEVDGRRDDLFSSFVGLHLRRTRHLGYRLQVDWERRDSTTDSADYSELAFFAAVRYQR